MLASEEGLQHEVLQLLGCNGAMCLCSVAPMFRHDAAEAPTQQEPLEQSIDARLADEAEDTLSSTTSTSVPIGDTSQDTLGTTSVP